MRIALIILHADRAKGGAETYTCDLANALVARGHHVDLLAASFGTGIDQKVIKAKVEARGVTRLGRYESFLTDVDRQLDLRRYDVVHAMLPVRRCGVYHPHAGLAADAIANDHLKKSSPLKQQLSGLANRLNRKRQRFAAVERSLLSRETSTAGEPPIVICLSEYIKRTVRAHYDLPEAKLATLINAVDLGRFDPAASMVDREPLRSRLGIGADQVVALMVAQDFARKGLSEAIAAWKRVADERLVLLVVGKDDFSPYAGMAADAPYPKHLICAGPTSDVRQFYAASDLFVLPTRHDPCSLVVLEALAMGLPVISTRFNGACEVMTPSQHGEVLADPSDIVGLAEALKKLLSDDVRTAQRQACLMLRPRLAYEHHLDALEGLYARTSKLTL